MEGISWHVSANKSPLSHEPKIQCKHLIMLFGTRTIISYIESLLAFLFHMNINLKADFDDADCNITVTVKLIHF